MAKNGFVSAMDSLPWIVKLILCIPVLNFIWGIYRIVKGLSKNNAAMWVAGILWIIPGFFICWIIDLICVIINKRPTVLA